MQPILNLELRNKILDIIFDHHIKMSAYGVFRVVKFLGNEIYNVKKKSKSWDILSCMSKKIHYDILEIIYEYFIRDYTWNANDDEFVEILSLYFNEFMLDSSHNKNEAYEKIVVLLKENDIDLHLNYGMKEIEPEENIAGLKAYKNVITVAIRKSKEEQK